MAKSTDIIHHPHLPVSEGTVMPVIERACTILFDSLHDFDHVEERVKRAGQTAYGRHGTSISFHLESLMSQLENASGSVITASGTQAITTAISCFANAGSRVLISDNAYICTQEFCDQVLPRLGIEVIYFDPRSTDQLESLITKNTSLIYLESPGSNTFEIHDTRLIAQMAKANNIVTIMDNTWATPIFQQPLDLGIDISLHSLSKNIGGHSDLLLGAICCNEAHFQAIKKHARLIGNHVANDDVYLAIRGIKTLPQRLKLHEQAGLKVAHWLMDHPKINEVIHPALENHPDHALWQRDFCGSNSLFSFMIDKTPRDKLADFIDSLKYYGLGFSWGGFESMLIPSDVPHLRSATPWSYPGNIVRVYVGLEDTDELIADLAQGLDRL